MPSKDVVLSEGEYEAVKALLRSHKVVMSTKLAHPPYIVRLPEVCRPLVFAATGSAVSVAGTGGVAIEESVLTNAMLERLEKV